MSERATIAEQAAAIDLAAVRARHAQLVGELNDLLALVRMDEHYSRERSVLIHALFQAIFVVGDISLDAVEDAIGMAKAYKGDS